MSIYQGGIENKLYCIDQSKFKRISTSVSCLASVSTFYRSLTSEKKTNILLKTKNDPKEFDSTIADASQVIFSQLKADSLTWLVSMYV